jgi:dephospho-CoA kinase
MKCLVTGNGGTGKSAVCLELKRRGYFAIDADDYPGLSRWEDKNGKLIEVDYTKFVDYDLVSWNWDKTKIEKILKTNKDLFLCGSASNQFDFYNYFGQVIVLNVSPNTQRQRLKTRENAYGKDEETINWIIEDQRKVIESSLKRGSVLVDANGTLTETVDQILAVVDENS